VGEDGLDGEGVLDGGDNTQPAATAGTSENIEGEHVVHQRRPGPGVRGHGSTGAGLERVSVRGRATVADDLRAPARTRGEDAVIQEQVHRGPGNDGRQLLQEFGRNSVAECQLPKLDVAGSNPVGRSNSRGYGSP
jgi:hypothetical protein